MYSEEIDVLIKQHNFYIAPDTYMEICHYSPQISRIKYTPFDNGYFEIWTNDGYYWKFFMTH